MIKFINLKFIMLWIKYSLSKYSRYKYIFKTILEIKPKTILEIGVYKGKRSSEMINLAQSINDNIEFYGFDLFEKITKKKIKSELSKNPFSKNKLFKKLNHSFPSSKINLIQGDTTLTLKKFKPRRKISFVFIDGGHSIKTIKKDWLNIKKLINKKSVVIFDDYYENNEISKKFGCKKIIEKLEKKFDSKIFPSTDFVKVGSKLTRNHLVKVAKKSKIR